MNLTRNRSLLLIVLSGLVLGATSLAYPLYQHDSSLFALFGQTILEGGAPYRDIWDVKGPGIFLVNALSILLFGLSDISLRIFDLLWHTVTALLLGQVAWKLYRREGACCTAALAYLAFYFSQNARHWALSDGELNLPLAAAFLALFHACENDRIAWWALAGAGVGIATLFKLPMGIVGILMLVAAFRAGGAWRLLVPRLAALALGFGTPLGLVLAYLHSVGGLAAFLETQFVYAPRYVAAARETMGLSCILFSLARPVLVPLHGLAVFVVATLGFDLWEGRRVSFEDALLYGWALLSVLVLAVHSALFIYHFFPIVPPVCILAAEAAAQHAAQFRARRSLRAGASLAFLALLLVVPAKKFAEHVAFSWDVFVHHAQRDVWREPALYLQARTQPTDRIYVWGNSAASIYLHSGRKSASRYTSLEPLHARYRDLPYRDTLMRELAAHPPVYILVVHAPPYAVAGASACHMDNAPAEVEDGRKESMFKAFRDLLDTQYRLEKDAERYTIYRRLPEGKSAIEHRSTFPLAELARIAACASS